MIADSARRISARVARPQILVCRCGSTVQVIPRDLELRQAQGSLPGFHQIRRISNANPVLEAKKENEVEEMPNTEITPANMLETGAYAGLCVYGLSLGSIALTQYFMGLNMSTMAVYGFSTGLATGLGSAGVIWKFFQLFDIRAEDVFQLAMSKLRASTRVNKTIGSGKPSSFATGVAFNSDINAGEGRAYKIEYGTLEFRTPTIDNWAPVSFVYPRVQMIFQVQGSSYDGMAIVEGKKSWGTTKLDLVALDVLKKGEEQVILVQGEEDRLEDGSTDALRSFLDYKEQHLHE